MSVRTQQTKHETTHATNRFITTTGNGNFVATGYGIRVYVERGHLVVHAGIGSERETRRFNRASSRLSRLFVVGPSGFVTLEALSWLRGIGAAFVQIGPDGELVALSAATSSDQALLRRAQALAPYTGA